MGYAWQAWDPWLPATLSWPCPGQSITGITETLGPCGLQQEAEWRPQVGRDLGQIGVQGIWGVCVSMCKVLLSRGSGQGPWMGSSALWGVGTTKVSLQL